MALVSSCVAFAIATTVSFTQYYSLEAIGLLIASVLPFIIFQLTWCSVISSWCIFFSIVMELIIEILFVKYVVSENLKIDFTITVSLVLYAFATILVIIFIASKRYKKAIEKLRGEVNQEATAVEVVAELPTSNNQSEIQDQEATSTTALEVEAALPLSNGTDDVPIVHDVERIPDDVNTPTASARVQT